MYLSHGHPIVFLRATIRGERKQVLCRLAEARARANASLTCTHSRCRRRCGYPPELPENLTV
ncbi:hypothetical protein DPMN_048909 [Dreissena polymorpha]|uniref:Uncharacterized protein n=1 Tax=Dreissena polymorpha TaxID=45954 RepID=A0A9D4DE89_DREPO|nr:hypothetical protein DPMN_048909 [Dreissena polymorpha]